MEAQKINRNVEIDTADHPHACYGGWVFMGHEVELGDGDVDVEYIRLPCRRCQGVVS
jgi:hypothetical protein